METGLNTTFNISTNNEILTMKNIVKDYVMGEETSHVLKGIDLSVNEGEFLAILGPSGSGKSTLMNIIGCLDVPTSGKYILSGRTIADMDEKTLAHIRGREIGFIFQQFNLLPKQDALENVELPMIYAGVHEKERRERATVLLEKVGLGDKLHHFPNQMSGGQQQRVAIARALVGQPAILLADEPTGALDRNSGKEVLKLFQCLSDMGNTIVMITHDLSVAEHAKRVVRIVDGELYEN